MVCKKCETVLQDGVRFCPVCGEPVENIQGAQDFSQNVSNVKHSNDNHDHIGDQNVMPQKGIPQKPEKKNSMLILTIVTVASIVIIATVIVICFAMMNQSSKKTSADMAVENSQNNNNSDPDHTTVANDSQTEEDNILQTEHETEKETVPDDSAEFFKKVAGEYTFASGAGGWATVVTIDETGRFEGSYHDSEMGASGDGYDATIYVSNFSGQLGSVTKISDMEYTAYVESIEYQDKVDDQEIRDNVLYIYTGAYGIDQGKTLHFYMQGSKTAQVDTRLMDWLAMPLAWGNDTPETLPFNTFYNEEDDAGFFGSQE